MSKKFFRLADHTKTETVYFGPEEDGDDRDWIRIRSSVTKAEATQMLAKAPAERDIIGGVNLLESVFDQIIVDWSLVGGDGEKIAPTRENYLLMESEGAMMIQDAVAKQFNKILGREVEESEKE